MWWTAADKKNAMPIDLRWWWGGEGVGRGGEGKGKGEGRGVDAKSALPWWCVAPCEEAVGGKEELGRGQGV